MKRKLTTLGFIERHFKSKVAGLLAICFVSTLSAFSQSQSLEGRISDSINGAIESIKVIATNPNGHKTEARTNDNGEFSLDLLNNTYTLHFEAPQGFASRTLYNFEWPQPRMRGVQSWILDVDLEGVMLSEFICQQKGNGKCKYVYVSRIVRSNSLKLAGAVKDQNGQRLKGVAIKVSDASRVVFSKISDRQGRFVLNLKPDRYLFEFRKNGFVTFIISNVETKVGKLNWDVTLQRSRTYD